MTPNLTRSETITTHRPNNFAGHECPQTSSFLSISSSSRYRYPPTPPPPTFPRPPELMKPTTTRSPRLVDLAARLRRYKSPYNSNPVQDTRFSGESKVEFVARQGQRETNSESSSSSPPGIQSRRTKSNRAAVLICLFEGENGDLRVILTKRSSKLSTHSGEVALPGGKVEEGDANVVETALREAEEEIGLDPSLVEAVTVLESFTTKFGVTVFPVICMLWDKSAFIPSPNAAEVEAIFDSPLEMFLKDENRREAELELPGDKYLLHFFDYEAENNKFVIWALTAGILIRAASIVYQREPAFQERIPKFWHRSRQ